MTKMNKICHGKHGTTTQQRGIALIEAMVALLIVSFGALGLVGMHLFLNRNADVAKQRSEAARLAQAEMEAMRVYRTIGTSSDALFWTNIIKNDTTAAAVTTGTASNPYTSNTTYALQRSVPASDPSAGKYKEVQVRVTWLDRSGENQAIVFKSVMNGVDPSTAVSLSIVPNGSNVRDTLGRNVSIPIPSKNLGDGTSAFKPRSDGTTLVVFDNATGLIKKICTIAQDTQSAQIKSPESTLTRSNCTEKNAYLLSGYIRFKTGNLPPNFNPIDAINPDSGANEPPPAGITRAGLSWSTTWSVGMTMNDAAPTSGTQGLLSLLAKNSPAWNGSVSERRYIDSTTGVSVPTCFAESLKTISFTAAVNYILTNNGSTTSTNSTTVYLTIPASIPSPYTAAAIAPYTTHPQGEISNIIDRKERYVGYSCIIDPIDLDNNPSTLNAWTGLVKLSVVGTGAAISASINTTNDDYTYKVCRFSADYNLSFKPFLPSPPNPANTPNPPSLTNYASWYPMTPVPANATTQNVDKIDNEEHPYAYLNVQRSLSNQNFLVISGNQNCPSSSGVEVNGTGSETYTDTSTVLHQP